MTHEPLRPLRSYALLAAFVAAATLVVLPAVHGVHAPHLNGAAALEAEQTAIAGHADAEAATCPLCLAAGQARTAIASRLALFVPIATTAVRAPLRAAAPPIVATHAPAAPRAPPA